MEKKKTQSPGGGKKNSKQKKDGDGPNSINGPNTTKSQRGPGTPTIPRGEAKAQNGRQGIRPGAASKNKGNGTCSLKACNHHFQSPKKHGSAWTTRNSKGEEQKLQPCQLGKQPCNGGKETIHQNKKITTLGPAMWVAEPQDKKEISTLDQQGASTNSISPTLGKKGQDSKRPSETLIATTKVDLSSSITLTRATL